MVATQLPRIFRLMQGQKTPVELTDPGPMLTPHEVARFYAPSYPLLTTASINGPKISDEGIVYEFVGIIGTKG